MGIESKYISTAVAAERIGVDPRHVRVLIDSGKLKGLKIGRNWLVSIASVAKFERSPKMGRPKKHASETT